jgi:hypothetical protein
LAASLADSLGPDFGAASVLARQEMGCIVKTKRSFRG